VSRDDRQLLRAAVPPLLALGLIAMITRPVTVDTEPRSGTDPAMPSSVAFPSGVGGPEAVDIVGGPTRTSVRIGSTRNLGPAKPK